MAGTVAAKRACRSLRRRLAVLTQCEGLARMACAIGVSMFPHQWVRRPLHGIYQKRPARKGSLTVSCPAKNVAVSIHCAKASATSLSASRQSGRRIGEYCGFLNAGSALVPLSDSITRDIADSNPQLKARPTADFDATHGAIHTRERSPKSIMVSRASRKTPRHQHTLDIAEVFHRLDAGPSSLSHHRQRHMRGNRNVRGPISTRAANTSGLTNS